jgi:hypothetical protein
MKFPAYLWAGPNTCLGIALGWLLGGTFDIHTGVVEIHGPRVAAVLNGLWLPATAITLGHCVLGQNADALRMTRVHERVHVNAGARFSSPPTLVLGRH